MAAASLMISIKLKGNEDDATIDKEEPLRMWDKSVEKLTGLICEFDVEPIYNHLLCRIRLRN